MLVFGTRPEAIKMCPLVKEFQRHPDEFNTIVCVTGQHREAKVIGEVTIGDDVIIGANAVVVKDVPSHSIVAGVPARVIKTKNCISEEWVKVK